MSKIAIIGTAGRNIPITRPIWEWACEKLEEELAGDTSYTLCSGGAAGADHIAVKFFNLGLASALELHLPEILLSSGYKDSGIRDFRTNPGGTSNFYHRKFAGLLYNDENTTLKELWEAYSSTHCKSVVQFGFHNRNSSLVDSLDPILDRLIAFTFSKNSTPDDGGTADTYKKALKRKIPCLHISLPRL